MKLTFLGATETVTGSKYLLEHDGLRVLVDCGLFQGTKNLRLRNWRPLPIPADTLDAVVVTHAHLDHSGYLPVLARAGYRGPVYCTQATAALCDIMLRDSARLQEEEANFANRHGYSKHHPALPLYTTDDAQRALQLLKPRRFDECVSLGHGLSFRLLPAGHILGAASVVMHWQHRVLVFSGDLGRSHDPIMHAPTPPVHADFVVVESTYGDRLHPDSDPEAELAALFDATFARGGVVVIPSFTVGRAQEILHYIARLKASGRMARVPVYLDSPMATDVTDVYRHHLLDHRLTMSEADALGHAATMVRTVEQSKAIAERQGPMVIVAGSGMATGGRVLHHLSRYAPDARNTIALVGYQAAGTRGAALAAHEPTLKIHGEYVRVRARVETISALSAHADYEEILAWLGAIRDAPSRTFVTHGEPAAADALRRRIEERLHWRCEVPTYGECVDLDDAGLDAPAAAVPTA
ncbi:MBL fold metallo-hydrolase RNA specificity domain-containing protein [Burkholderia pseudomultivorans]|uniref:Ribonuclease n=1 Tax=Burkholderia pseudomultivorans TaxID=1207504 RepID=A0ABU2E421_9BURK|nr:MBL fold metallo-hydrolase [Burkholderia pseudomultivorans]MDR8728095.1 Ribonuclease [Burkholderia pseudomultivorans]MDR8737119.1 Ribonuclease [Burkholderia pseudomultivorans]MDR8740326.1 Ribonuclease [Burkholderia pseudomultivorans]MDR8754590.1 Ribonuclease [Burkholderia pseudomultivorans]MDR8776740.1 Ribonuclease [Burkholderia pseudomultivorans]